MTAPQTASLILARLRARARRLALWMETQWAGGRTSPDQGLAISAGEVGRILQPVSSLEAEAAAFAGRPDVLALAAPIAAADAALAADPFWRALQTNFGLAPAEADLLALALGEALDPEFGRVIAYLHDDTRKTRATAWLAARLFENAGRCRAPPPDAVVKWRLAVPLEGQAASLPATAFEADPAVLAYVATGIWADARLRGIATLAGPDEATAPILYPEALAAMLAARAGNPAVGIDLLGPEGSGRRVLAGQFAAAAGLRLLVVDGEALGRAGSAAEELLIACARMAQASGATIFWRRADCLPQPLPDALAGGGLRALPGDAITRPDALVVRLGKPTVGQRLAVWRHLNAGPAPEIVTSQRLTLGEVALAAHASAGGATAIRLALRRAAPQGDILSRLECPYDWDDLVVPGELRAQLREVAAQIRLRWEVYEEWGFGRLAHLGEGIAALFAGPSGTGKTMAAQVLARMLDLDLYRVDLAGVVNKYIGETEKRLRDVFAFGERAGTMLFFDEADALFGSRMEVKDSHDRFANIEIDYLLQRIERFDGIVILATNRKSDIDGAFLRRLRFVVDFVPPGPAERRMIWRKALPETTPAGEKLLDEIDWAMLAERLNLTGAEIKSAALGAAFLGRGEGGRIGMRHVLAAVQREMAKRGQLLRLRPAKAVF